MKRTALSFENLTVAWGEKVPIRDLTLEIFAGETTALLGRSGCGKTTLLRVAAGLIKPTAGRVHFPSGGAEVGMAFQSPSLFPWKSVRENVALAVRKMPADERDARVARELARVGLTEVADLHPAALSGGMASRVGLARAMVAEPEISLMDEPFAALDALTRLTLQAECEAWFTQRRATVLWVTHDPREAARLADRAVILGEGGILADLRNEAAHPRALDDPQTLAFEQKLLTVLLA